MYGVVYIFILPGCEDPELISLDIFSTFEEAQNKSEELIEDFIENYGEDYVEHATVLSPKAIMYNGDVTAFAYIEKCNVFETS